MSKNSTCVEVTTSGQGSKRHVIFAMYGETVQVVLGEKELKAAERALSAAHEYVQELLTGMSIRAKGCGTDAHC